MTRSRGLAALVVAVTLAMACEEPGPGGVPERRLRRLEGARATVPSTFTRPTRPLPPVLATAAPSVPQPARVPREWVVECSSASGRLQAKSRGGDLWIQRDGGAPEPLVERATANVVGEQPGTPLSEGGIYGCQFAPDERSLYFIADNYGTSRGLFAVSLQTRLVALLDAGNAFFVIHECREQTLIGSIAVYRHEYFRPLSGFAYDWWVLIRPSGKEVGPIGQDENLDRFMFRRCGQGEAPPAPPPRSLLQIANLRAACSTYGGTLKSTPLLDGTMLDVVNWHEGSSANSATGLLASDLVNAAREWECAKGLKL